MKTILETTI